MLELDYAETVPCRPYIVRNQTEDSKGPAGQATQPARQAAPNHHASTPISKPPWTDGEGLPKGRFLRRSEHDRPCLRAGPTACPLPNCRGSLRTAWASIAAAADRSLARWRRWNVR